MSDLVLHKKAVIQFESLCDTIDRSNNLSDVEKYQKKSVKQIRNAIKELVMRRNGRAQVKGKILSNQN